MNPFISMQYTDLSGAGIAIPQADEAREAFAPLHDPLSEQDYRTAPAPEGADVDRYIDPQFAHEPFYSTSAPTPYPA